MLLYELFLDVLSQKAYFRHHVEHDFHFIIIKLKLIIIIQVKK